jgi:hypothetical protein
MPVYTNMSQVVRFSLAVDDDGTRSHSDGHGNRGRVCSGNTHVFASCCEASLYKTSTTYCADLMDNRVIVTQQRAANVLKTPSQASSFKFKFIMISGQEFDTIVRLCVTIINPFQKPIENAALNSRRAHRFGLAFQL